MRRFAMLAAVVATVFLAGCRSSSGGSSSSASSDRLNVLLVTIDTLRADRLGCYGYAAAATPTLDALAAGGVRFKTAVAHVPLTGPSHASILTGRTPVGHGFRNNSGFVVAKTLKTAAEIFREAGYRTGAVIAGFPLDRRFGFDRGFDVYEDHLPRGNDPRRTPYVERPANATTDAAHRWLHAEKSPPRPWFLWVHYYDPHAPYEPPRDLAERFANSPYDGEVAFVDRELGRLIREVESTGQLSRTLVLVTADHGEALGEHGEGTHGVFVYDATLRVPWIMAGPAIPHGVVVSEPVARSIDVLPTLLDVAGLPRRPDVDGRSLRPAAEGHRMTDAASYAESLYPQIELGWAPLHAWRTATAKFIDAPKPEFYDLEHDAAETTNQISSRAATAADLRRSLDDALRAPTPAAVAAVDPEAAERLRALGYVAAGGGSSRSARTTLDPKDGVKLLPRLNRGMSAARTEPELAIRELTAVLTEDPDLLMARRTRAVAYAAAGRHELAIADLRLLESQKQLTPEDAVVLGDNLRFAGRLDEAAAVLTRTAHDNPTFPQPWLSLAEVRIQEQKYSDAARACERVLQLVPDHLEAMRRLGDLAFLDADFDAAGARYIRILELDPTDVPAMTKLGVVRMRTGRPDEAMRLFRAAIDREPNNGEALLYLAGALASRGAHADALPYFQRALDVTPRSTMVLNGLGLTRLALGDRSGAAAALRQSLRLDPHQADVARTLADLSSR